MSQSSNSPTHECFITVGLLDGEITLTITNGTLDNNTIKVEPHVSKKKVVFATTNFTVGNHEYRVDGYTVSAGNDVQWTTDPTTPANVVSAPTERQGRHHHEINGTIKLKVFGPLDTNGNSNTEVDTVQPATTIVFEDDLHDPPVGP